MVEHDQSSPSEQRGTERGTQLPAPGHVLLDCHHGAESKHPTHVARTDGEHQQHQRPAVTHAKNAMIYTKQKCVSVITAASPVLHDEAHGRAAFVQTAVFQTAKLKAPSQQQRAPSDGPGIRFAPCAALHYLAQHPSSSIRRNTKARPHTQSSR